MFFLSTRAFTKPELGLAASAEARPALQFGDERDAQGCEGGSEEGLALGGIAHRQTDVVKNHLVVSRLFQAPGIIGGQLTAGQAVIAFDTNILARFYCDDPADPKAARQRPRAKRVMLESALLFVPLTVVLEFEWVTRGFYELPPTEFCRAIEHLLGMPHVTAQRWEAVHDALV